MQGQCFNKAERLQKRRSFVLLSKRGRKLHFPYFLVFFSENKLKHPRLGITSSKKTGNAVKRNRIKRLVREYFRTEGRFILARGLDINLIAKKELMDKSSSHIFFSLKEIFNRLAKESLVKK